MHTPGDTEGDPADQRRTIDFAAVVRHVRTVAAHAAGAGSYGTKLARPATEKHPSRVRSGLPPLFNMGLPRESAHQFGNDRAVQWAGNADTTGRWRGLLVGRPM